MYWYSHQWSKTYSKSCSENGQFKSSRTYRQSKEDFVVLEEAIIEIEAQYKRFKEITHLEPSYFEAHAVASDNLLRGIEIVAKRHNLKFNDISFDGTPVDLAGEKLYMHMESMKEAMILLNLLKKW